MAYFWQPPVPLHLPLSPHGGESAHPPAGGAAPAGTKLHVPRDVDSAHDLQSALQSPVQHTPWRQKPDVHSLSAVHEAPVPFLPQLPIEQTLPAVQSPEPEHMMRQSVTPLHM